MVCRACGRENPADFRFCGACGAPLTAVEETSAGVRKTVTVVFCDVTGSTALGESTDPEALRGILARYFERMREIVEGHGGTVEKFIGDAVMAVFGVPVAHEDDALRAIRAAAEMRAALPELGVQARIGVNTGEVVAGTTERLATGDAVNVAARLEQAAPPGQVLLGAPTLALVRDAVEVEKVEPLALKGKAEPVAAYRLVGVQPEPQRRHETPFVGREQELGLARDAWERTRAERRCELVTITADAGVGKSRLVAEALASVGARIARGRCPSYGEGITYWPVVEVLKQLAVVPDDDAAAAAIRSLLGETNEQTSAEEIAWAVRKTLEQTAVQDPLVVVFEDVHWGEDAFLDLVEHVALLSAGAPLLLVCTARPELLERRPQWSVTFRLEPLGAPEVEQLIPGTIDAALRQRIARAAGGNPLYLTEMLAMTAETDGDVVVPPTLQALLTARLDQLEPSERNVLQCAAIEGEVFHRGGLQALAPDEPQVTPRLAALVRKGLIAPEPARLAGEDAFRFRHLLVRDTAYDALPKATRAELHERAAHWLEGHGGTLVELDEIIGYHLERSVRYRHELGSPVEDALAAAARRHLAAAGVRARIRGDDVAAASLLERGRALLLEGDLDLGLELDLIDALYWAGRADDAVAAAASLGARAEPRGDRVAATSAAIKETLVRVQRAPEGATADLAGLLDEALPQFEAAGDDVALFHAYYALGQVKNMHAEMDAMVDACERAAAHASRTGRPYEFVAWRATGRLMGTTPLSELLAWLDEQEARGSRYPRLPVRRAGALAMLGRFEEARSIMEDMRARLAESGGIYLAAALSVNATTDRLAGDHAAAATSASEALRLFEEHGVSASASTVAAELAQALYELGRFEEAESQALHAAALGASDDTLTQMLWRQAHAKILARRGDHDEAERLAREAVAIGEATDMLNQCADAYADLGEVMSLAGRTREAAAALREALARYERKENLVMAERIRSRLVETAA